ncbi:MAG: CDP-alcohol phosphatidyltransferase family protein [Rhodospirillales bacterium]|jgi:phosphatidylglycerophosphate synthase|nr:CDP-alcohol phosphatidyltransferase family protein [Rhodospirillales bacterium]
MSHNTWIHRGVRVLVRPLVGTPVTPNQLTSLRLLTGLSAAGAFAVGTEPWQYCGAGLFILSMLFDRADGELARLGGKTTPWGHNFDLLSDLLSETLVFIGLGIGLSDSILGAWAIPMGIVAGLAVALTFWLFQRAGPQAGATQPVAGFDPDDALVFVPLAVVLGGSVPLLVAAATGAPAFAAYSYWRLRADLKG